MVDRDILHSIHWWTDVNDNTAIRRLFLKASIYLKLVNHPISLYVSFLVHSNIAWWKTSHLANAYVDAFTWINRYLCKAYVGTSTDIFMIRTNTDSKLDAISWRNTMEQAIRMWWLCVWVMICAYYGSMRHESWDMCCVG